MMGEAGIQCDGRIVFIVLVFVYEGWPFEGFLFSINFNFVYIIHVLYLFTSF